MIGEFQKLEKNSNRSLVVFLSMVIILASILFFTVFLTSNFKMFFAEQAKENAYLESMLILHKVNQQAEPPLELKSYKKSSEHQIYLLDHSLNLIASTEQNVTGGKHSFDLKEAGLSKYKEKILSQTIFFATDKKNEFYIFFAPVSDNKFILISKIPVKPLFSAKNFLFDRIAFIPATFFIIVIILVSIFVVILMALEQRKREKVEAESLTDPLTKIYNRRYFDKALHLEFSRMKREKKPISFIMIDIDHFKKYNDTYGHSQGDELLKVIAKIFTKCVRRGGDFVARLGGEEFGILLANTDKEGAVKVAETVLSMVEKTKVQVKGTAHQTSVNISLGVASFIPQDDESPEMLYGIADDMLYKAKASGRGRVCH
ncbi:MAG: GGDEF domain-containing protein [Fibromonadaceae bacterium]|jgi:diguanylate cyclase (GGDEF)-like protein|nr:GGDEF domain-containing protein [Fibromonadaceae bacterium]